MKGEWRPWLTGPRLAVFAALMLIAAIGVGVATGPIAAVAIMAPLILGVLFHGRWTRPFPDDLN